MSLVRILLVIVLTMSTSLSSAMGAGHMIIPDHEHATVEAIADGQPLCCQDSMERTQICQFLLALLPALTLSDTAPVTGEDAFCTSDVLLTGLEPSGPLDPPRAM